MAKEGKKRGFFLREKYCRDLNPCIAFAALHESGNGMARPRSAVYLLDRGREAHSSRSIAIRTPQNTPETISTMGIDVGKNTFHL